jgi:hypothetical protein
MMWLSVDGPKRKEKQEKLLSFFVVVALLMSRSKRELRAVQCRAFEFE